MKRLENFEKLLSDKESNFLSKFQNYKNNKMQTSNKLPWYYKMLIGVLILIIVSILFSKCENEKTASATIQALQSENTTYKLKNGQLVTSQKTAILSEKELKHQLSKYKNDLELAKKFVKIKTFTKYRTNTEIDTISIVYKDSIPCNFERVGSLFTNEYNLAYKSNQKGVQITEMAIPDTVLIATGYKRKWFLGQKILTLDITHSNKFIMSDQVQNYEVKEKKKFWQTDLFKFGAGLIIGVAITK